MLVADIAHIAGLIAGGAHPSPVGHAEVISTTTHKTLRGPRGAMLMCGAEHAQRHRPRRLPWPARRAAQPHDSRDRGCARGGGAARVRRLRAARRSEREGARDWTAGAGLRPRLGRDRQPPDPGRPNLEGRPGKARRKGARPRRASPPTTTPSLTIRASRSTPRGSASARPR